MSVWTEFLQNKKFEIKDDYGIFLHEFRTPMFFSTERDLMTYISDTDLKEILYIKFKEDENFKLFGSEKKHQEIINSTEKKKFKNSFLWFIVILIGSLVYHYFVKEIDFKELKLFIIIGGVFPITEMFFEYRNLTDVSSQKHQKFIENSIFSFWLQKSNTKFFAYLIPTILALSFGFQEILTLGKSTQFDFVNEFALIKSRLDLGEYERLLTYLFVHYNMLNISAIFGALYFLSRIFFQFYNLSLFILIFAVTRIVGGLSSVIILPQEISYGASSAVLGILGFLVVIVFKHKDVIPTNIIKDLVNGSLYVAVLGIAGYEFINNAANFGGFIAGALIATTIDNKDEIEHKIKKSLSKIKF